METIQEQSIGQCSGNVLPSVFSFALICCTPWCLTYDKFGIHSGVSAILLEVSWMFWFFPWLRHQRHPRNFRIWSYWSLSHRKTSIVSQKFLNDSRRGDFPLFLRFSFTIRCSLAMHNREKRIRRQWILDGVRQRFLPGYCVALTLEQPPFSSILPFHRGIRFEGIKDDVDYFWCPFIYPRSIQVLI